MVDIVKITAKVFRKKAVHVLIDKGDAYAIGTRRIRDLDLRKGVDFGSKYLEHKVENYFNRLPYKYSS
tara:strand:+ start:204 stop:407 length:204 start_codon:yes stop_codon:yes gene_type:complete